MDMDKWTNMDKHGQTWIWLKSFLVVRQNRVMYRGALSSWTPVTSGVPQGSVLGPLLFNLFIRVSTNCLLFADDTLLYHPITLRDGGARNSCSSMLI